MPRIPFLFECYLFNCTGSHISNQTNLEITNDFQPHGQMKSDQPPISSFFQNPSVDYMISTFVCRVRGAIS